MSSYFFVIFEVQYLIFRYDVYLEEYMNLSLTSISGITSKDTKPTRKTERSGSNKNLK